MESYFMSISDDFGAEFGLELLLPLDSGENYMYAETACGLTFLIATLDGVLERAEDYVREAASSISVDMLLEIVPNLDESELEGLEYNDEAVCELIEQNIDMSDFVAEFVDLVGAGSILGDIDGDTNEFGEGYYAFCLG